MAYVYTNEELGAMSDGDLLRVTEQVTGVTAGAEALGWPFLGRLVSRLEEVGVTVHLSQFEPGHLASMQRYVNNPRNGYLYPDRRAEVTLVDLQQRVRGPDGGNLRARADDLPRALAVAAVLLFQALQTGQAIAAEAPKSVSGRARWTEERRQAASQRMREWWQHRRVAAD